MAEDPSVGKESIEGYKGGNWPAKNGNPSGKGRGNAEPSGFCDDEFDDDDFGGVPMPLPSQIAERNRQLMEARLPPIPSRSEEIDCTIKQARWGIDLCELELIEYPGRVFRFHRDLFRYNIENDNWAAVTMNLIGDRVRLVVHPDRYEWPIYRMHNLTLDDYRRRKENCHQTGMSHRKENELRSGRLGMNSSQKALLFNPEYDEGDIPRWFVKSGDFVCSHLGFGSLQMASYWMDTMCNEISGREGAKFRLALGLFACSIVDQDGRLPESWESEPGRYYRDYHEHLKNRW